MKNRKKVFKNPKKNMKNVIIVMIRRKNIILKIKIVHRRKMKIFMEIKKKLPLMRNLILSSYKWLMMVLIFHFHKIKIIIKKKINLMMKCHQIINSKMIKMIKKMIFGLLITYQPMAMKLIPKLIFMEENQNYIKNK